MCVRAARQRQLMARNETLRPAAPRPAGSAPVAAAAIILYPFTPTTDPVVAAALLLQHVSYHLQMGVAKVVQYTQARAGLCRAAVLRVRHEKTRASRLPCLVRAAWQQMQPLCSACTACLAACPP